MRGEIEDLDAAPHLIARDAAGAVLAETTLAGGPRASHPALDTLLDFAGRSSRSRWTGGRRPSRRARRRRSYRARGDHARAVTALEALTPLDPLHMPDNLAPMRAVAAARPSSAAGRLLRYRVSPHDAAGGDAVRACRATSADDGVRRYGFHGLSYEYIAGRLAQQSPALARGRVIVAHLGSGASLCALNGGRSIETTTGFSALDGLVMATRCGSLDPGVILYLGRKDTASPISRTCCTGAPACSASPASAATSGCCWQARIRMREKRSTCSPIASLPRQGR